jgi:hypothetical protein
LQYKSRAPYRCTIKTQSKATLLVDMYVHRLQINNINNNGRLW